MYIYMSSMLTNYFKQKQLPSGLEIKVAVVVEIDVGVTTFAVATLASMVYSMLFIYFDEKKRLQKIIKHKDKDENDEKEINEIDCFENRIQKYSKLESWRNDGSFKIYALYDLPDSLYGIICRALFLALLITNLYLCIDTIYTAPVRYDIDGLAGWAVNDSHRSYSIIDTVNKLPSSTNEYNAAWFCMIQY